MHFTFGENPNSCIILTVGPLNARPCTKGAITITGSRRCTNMAVTSGKAKMGAMLSHGLEGQIITPLSSGVSNASLKRSLNCAVLAPTYAIFFHDRLTLMLYKVILKGHFINICIEIGLNAVITHGYKMMI